MALPILKVNPAQANLTSSANHNNDLVKFSSSRIVDGERVLSFNCPECDELLVELLTGGDQTYVVCPACVIKNADGRMTNRLRSDAHFPVLVDSVALVDVQSYKIGNDDRSMFITTKCIDHVGHNTPLTCAMRWRVLQRTDGELGGLAEVDTQIQKLTKMVAAKNAADEIEKPKLQAFCDKLDAKILDVIDDAESTYFAKETKRLNAETTTAVKRKKFGSNVVSSKSLTKTALNATLLLSANTTENSFFHHRFCIQCMHFLCNKYKVVNQITPQNNKLVVGPLAMTNASKIPEEAEHMPPYTDNCLDWGYIHAKGIENKVNNQELRLANKVSMSKNSYGSALARLGQDQVEPLLAGPSKRKVVFNDDDDAEYELLMAGTKKSKEGAD